MKPLHFYIYLFCCYATHPVRWFLGWLNQTIPTPFSARLYYPHGLFAMKYLFFNPYKFAFVFAQARLESKKNLDSFLATSFHNLFGMGHSSASKYQLGSWNSGKVGEPIFATYKNQYYGLYDYYDFVKNRKPQYMAALNTYPDQVFIVDSIPNWQYVGYVVGVYRGNRYFTAPLNDYLWSIDENEKSAIDYTVHFWCNIIVSIVLYITVAVYAVSSYRKLSGNKKAKNGSKRKFSFKSRGKKLYSS